MLEKLRTLLWYNEQYRATFTLHKSGDQYLWFTKDINTGIRQHRYYSVADGLILIELDDSLYKVTELKQRFIKETMIQLENVDDPEDYINLMGTDMPVIHGAPYVVQQTTLQYAR